MTGRPGRRRSSGARAAGTAILVLLTAVCVCLGGAPVAAGTPAPAASEMLGFWLRPPDADALRREAVEASGLPVRADGRPVIRSLADARTLRRALLATHAAANARLATGFRTTALALGVTDVRPLETAPLVIARVTPDQARALAASPQVVAAEPSGGLTLAMSSAYPTVGARAAYAAGFRGTGVRVGVVEYARIDFSNRMLDDVPRQKLYVARTSGGHTCRSGDPPDPDPSISHMTRVAAIIGGRSASAPRGVAPGVTIIQSSIDMRALDNDETAARVAKAVECAIAVGGADVINLSLSEPRRESYVRAYLDHLVATYGVLVVAAAGNAVYGSCPDGRVVPPGIAWNVLTVGGTDDRGTARRRDDRLWSEDGRNAVCSGDPRGQVGDRDRRIKPELSAVARNVSVAGYGPSSGTSYATPMVTAAAATLLRRDPVLATAPHVVKAILVASSRLHRTRAPSGRLDTDREGAGTLDVAWANAVVSGRKGRLRQAGGYGLREVGSSLAGSCRAGTDVTLAIPGHRGRRMRVVIVWNSHAIRPSLQGEPVDRRKSDLDLTVRGPGGRTIPGAGTSRNRLDASNTEWIDFTAPTDGPLTVRIGVSRWDCDLITERVGFAWVAFRP